MEEQKIKAHCNTCAGIKNHLVLFTETDFTPDENWWASATYKMIKCAGCDSVHLRHEYEFSEDTDAEGNTNVHVTYYPPALSRRRPDFMTGNLDNVVWAMNTQIGQLLTEIYAALQNGSNRLAAMGVRAVVEIMMIDKIGGDSGNFAGNINRFFEQGYVAAHQQQSFRAALIEAGHAAMHRGFKPTNEQLSILLDITEALIASIYFHEDRAAQLSSAIPPRQIVGTPSSEQ